MKKITAFLFLLFAYFISSAQNIKFGARAGINIANVSIKVSGLSFSASSLIGPNAGLFAEIPLAPTVFLQPEVAYSGMGFKVSSTQDSTNVSGKSKTNYLTIPLLVKVKIPATSLALYAGPQYGYLLSAKQTAEGQTEDTKENYKSSDFAGVVGAEYFFVDQVGLSARYQFGLANIAKEAEEGESLKNHGFSILLAVRL